MKHLVLDVETTTLNKGGPFDPRNKLCVISWKTKDEEGVYKIEYDDDPYGAAIAALQHLINIHDVLIFFNAKFDLHWLRKYGLDFRGKKIFDVQLAYFIHTAQVNRLPSLNAVAEYCGAGKKIDKIAEYWDSGIDTPQIPYAELVEYAIHDVVLTEHCYFYLLKQLEANPEKLGLVRLACQDLLVLEEMEWNGMKYDVVSSTRDGDLIQLEMKVVETQLVEVLDHEDSQHVNWNSPRQVSAVLFGGSFELPYKETYTFVYKDGREVQKQRNAVRVLTFPRLVTPPERAKTKEEGVWSTAEPVIKNLRATGKAKQIINLLLSYSKLEKLHGTYLAGIPAIMQKNQWGEYLHGQLNQTIARTGRLSSSSPNMQNMPGEVDKYFVSRFEDGLVVQFDVKGLEVVCAAYLSQDKVLIKELNDGEDIHANNQKAFNLHDRLAAKRFMFKMIYGGTANGFAGDPDFQDLKMSAVRWQEVIDAFYSKYSGIAAWHRKLIDSCLRNRGYSIPSGRQYDYADIMRNPEWYYVPKFKNYPVQGFGADIVMMARVSLFKRLKASGLSALMINTIHDSIILDIERKDWYNISILVKKVFQDLPTNIKNVWEIDLGLEVKVEASVLTTGEEIK